MTNLLFKNLRVHKTCKFCNKVTISGTKNNTIKNTIYKKWICEDCTSYYDNIFY